MLNNKTRINGGQKPILKIINKLLRRKQRGIKSQSQQFPSRQAAGNLPAEIKN